MNYIPKWLVQGIAGLLAILLIVLVVGQIYEIQTKTKSLDSSHIITISAEGKVTVAPDLATLNVAVQNNATTAADAQTANTQKMNAVIAYVKSQGVAAADIQTSGYNVNPNYDYTNNSQPKITGYTASQNLTVKVRDLTKVSTLLSGVVANGANSVNGVDYSFADPDTYREQAREAALKSAKQQAQNLAAAAGVHLGALVTFTESSDNPPVPMPLFANQAVPMAAGTAASPAPNVQPGTQDVTADITATYQIY